MHAVRILITLLPFVALGVTAVPNNYNGNGGSNRQQQHRPGGDKVTVAPSHSASAKRQKKDMIVFATLPLGSQADDARCPMGSMACPTVTVSFEDIISSTPWECVEFEEDLYSCGGCTTLGTGTDCASLPFVSAVSCHAATCVVHACLPGFDLIDGACSSDSIPE